MKRHCDSERTCDESTSKLSGSQPLSRRSMLAAAASTTTLLAGCEGTSKSASVKNLEVNPKYVCKGSTVTVDWEALGNEVELEIEQGSSTSSRTLYDGTYDTQSGTESVTVQEDAEISVIAKTSEGSADSKKKDVKVVPAGGREFIFKAQGECVDNGPGPGTVRYRFSADVMDWGSGVRVTSVTVQGAGGYATVAHKGASGSSSIGIPENGSTSAFAGQKPGGEWVIVKNAGEICENSSGNVSGGSGSSGDLGVVIIKITVACSDTDS